MRAGTPEHRTLLAQREAAEAQTRAAVVSEAQRAAVLDKLDELIALARRIAVAVELRP